MKLKRSAVFVFALLLASGILFTGYNAYAKTDRITMNKGKTYKLRLKKIKQYKFTSTKKKIASVSKKGVIHALKKGTCTIKASKKGKVYRYKVVVKNKNNNAQVQHTPQPPVNVNTPVTSESPDPVNTPEPSYMPPGNIIPVLKGEVVEYSKTQDGNVNYQIKINESSWYDSAVLYAYVTMPAYEKIFETGQSVYVVKNISDKKDIIERDTVTVSSGYVMG